MKLVSSDFLAIFFYLFCYYSYIEYSNIAAKVLRKALKPEFRAEAAKREETHVRFTQWKDGKPISEYTADYFFSIF